MEQAGVELAAQVYKTDALLHRLTSYNSRSTFGEKTRALK